ncbi:DNA repair protein RAD5A [Lachnellula hyalina]|uniref:DNA repair protein RAD5A n=1 Tax=Lachnellula hyalina TaxID=1316788 RepID=A0A8H8R232_9HELO|nr:DNA repair protein RAD5A [Lachnellula hyalina]TVY27092.1 DNA repair protein RAD5A [Lachnellula hyalina]
MFLMIRKGLYSWYSAYQWRSQLMSSAYQCSYYLQGPQLKPSDVKKARGIATIYYQNQLSLWLGSEAFNLGYSTDGRLKPKKSPDTSQQNPDSPNSPSPSTQSDVESTEWDEANKLPPLISIPFESTGDFSSDGLANARAAAKNNTCFGMIHNTRVKLLDPATVTRETPGEDLSKEDHLYSLELAFKDGCAFVSFPAKERFAVLNEGVAKVLRDISALSNCRFDAYLEFEEWRSLLESLCKSEKHNFFPIDIIIYGSKSIRTGIGTLLSDSKIYLQHPCYEEPDTDYDNPHFLKLDGLSSALQSSSGSLESGKQIISKDILGFNNKPVDELTTQSQLRRRMATVYDSLTRSKKLERIEADIRITTELLPHQEEALCFMEQRELGPVPSEFCLWQSRIRQNQSYYEHSITGLKTTECPTECIGGILADDMGLGKTLTVISTIIRTSERARSFATNQDGSAFLVSEKTENSQRAISRSTLVVVPSPLLIDEWLQEGPENLTKLLCSHCDGSLNVTRYHGRGREVDPYALADSDLVLSTYATIAAESLQPESALYRVIWFRVVLDEAHTVRNGSAKVFKAVSKIPGNFRWCLTGTPVQNSLEDLASLVAFIRAGPLDSLPDFRKHIISPLVKGTEQGMNNIRLLLDSICLRRTQKLLHLPEVSDEDRYIEFTASEKSLYSNTQAEMIKAIKQHDSHDRNTKGYFGIFQLQLQLRRLCNHGTFQRSFSHISAEGASFDPEEALALLKERGEGKCAYCNTHVTGLKDIEDIVSGKFTVCGHLLCSGCLPRFEEGLKTGKSTSRCPLCLRDISRKFLASDEEIAEGAGSNLKTELRYFEERGVSSKLSSLVMDLKQNTTEGKSIVFSCWTRSLDLVGRYLTLENIQFDRIDGTYSSAQRHNVLQHYHSDPNVRVLLMTTGTGAVGLNLTIASCVYLLEPQWNPMVESQAVARVLRLGQRRNVKVIRYIVIDTVEVGMRSQQSRKRDFARLGWKEDS